MTEALQGVEPPAGAVGTGAACVRLQAPYEHLQAELAAAQQREASQQAELEGVRAELAATQQRAESQRVAFEAALAAGQQREAGQRAELESTRAELEGARAAITALQQRVQELERRVGLNSTNSGKPPSSDGQRKPAAPRPGKSTRGGSGKRSGGQPGHKGTTLQQTADPDHVETHRPPRCADCGQPLTADDSVGFARRQVFDLPPPPRVEVTEHQAHTCECPACGHRTRAEFPDDVRGPVQYGPRIQAEAVYLQNWHLLPEQRTAELFRDLHGVQLSAATLGALSRQAADAWRECSERLRDLLAGADGAKHLDETGFRIAARGQWLHVLSTRWLTFYHTSARRSSLLEGLRGCLVHDHWKPYFTVPDVQHALCNAHHLRELEALAELDGEGWAHRLQVLLRLAGEAAWIAGAEGFALEPGMIAWFEERYDRLVAEALEYHEGLEPLRPAGRKGRKKRRPGHNLALRLRDFKTETLRFLHDPGVPFTNNQAERDLRMMKVRMKISGSFRSERGAQDFATLRSVLSTARKQGRNRIETLIRGPAVLLDGLRC